jgi:hypothetical protein
MTTRPLSPAMQKAMTAMLRGPLTRGRHVNMGDGWIAQDESFHALIVVRNLVTRGLVAPPMKLAVLTIAGRKLAQKAGGTAA